MSFYFETLEDLVEKHQSWGWRMCIALLSKIHPLHQNSSKVTGIGIGIHRNHLGWNWDGGIFPKIPCWDRRI